MEGNLFSKLVLFAWIPFAIYGVRRWGPVRGVAGLMLGGLLFLPEAVFFKLPGIPEFSKREIVPLWIAVGFALYHRNYIRAFSLRRIQKILIGTLMLGAVATVLLNTDPADVGVKIIQPHRAYDAVHQISHSLFRFVVPFLLSAIAFRGPKELRIVFRTFVGAALVYSLFQLVELRMSPQMHRWVYGFHQHQFMHVMREGGFRPRVFMSSSLAAATFTGMALIASVALHKIRSRIWKFKALGVVFYLGVLLILCKSKAVLLYALLGIPLIAFASAKWQVRVAALLSVFILFYPVVRTLDWIPTDSILEIVEGQFGEERAQSLEVRFENEEALVDRAMERPVFGWGSFCRACVFDEWSGREESIRDGDWIIMLGDWGYVGFLSKFLFLLLPVFWAWRFVPKISRPSDRRLLAALSLLVSLYAFDLLPNGDFNFLPFFLSGALFGCLSGVLREERKQRAAQRAD